MDADRPALGHGSNAPRWAAAAPLACVALFVAWPVAMVLITGLGKGSLAVLASASTWRILVYTGAQAAASTLLSLAFALPVAYAVTRLQLPLRRTLLAIITVPFILPTVVVGLAFRELLPFPGTTAAIIVAHVFFNVGLVVRVVSGLWEKVDPRYDDVGSSLGLAPWTRFRRVTLPLIRPALLASSVLVFLFCFTSFGVVLVVGDPALPTIEVEIYQRAIQRLDLSGAATLALLQLLVVIAAVVVSSRLQARLSIRQRLQSGEGRRRVTGLGDIAAASWAYALSLLIAIPLVALLARSLRVGDSWSTTWYVQIFAPTEETTRSVPVVQSIELSLRYAAIATLIAVGLGLLACIGIQAARRRGTWVDAVVTLPLGVSAVTIGLGLLLGSLRGPIDLRGWWLLVPLGQALVAMPIVVRVVLPILQSFDPRMRDVAATLGAPPMRAWLATEGAATAKAVGVAAALACAVSLGEFGATAFLVRLDTPTIPVQVVRLLGRPGEANIGQAAALSCILVTITVVIVALGERLRPRRGGGW